MNEKIVLPYKKVRTDICQKYKNGDGYDDWNCVFYEDKTCSDWENCLHYANGDYNMRVDCNAESEIRKLAWTYLSKIEGLDFVVWCGCDGWDFDIYVGDVSEKKDMYLIEKVENAIQELFDSRKWKNYLKKHNAVITKAEFKKREVVYDGLYYRVWWEKGR